MRILLIGADREKVGPLSSELKQHRYIVDLALDISTAKFLFEKIHHPLVILYHQHPAIDGIELCRAVREGNRHTLLLMLALPGECSVFDGFSAGIDRFMPLPVDNREVIARVNALARRTDYRSGYGSRLVAGDIVVDLDSKEVIRAGRSIYVTASEFRILEFMIQHKNQVVSREEIACGIWGSGMGGKAKKLPVHINNLRGKLMTDADDNSGIYTVSRRGYLMVDKNQ